MSGRTPCLGFPELMAAEELVPLIEEDAAEAERSFRQTDRVVAAAALSGTVRDAPLKYVLTSPPRYHHWHHWSDDEAIDKNYVAHLPVIDWLFGTSYMPKDKQIWPRRYGTVGVPLPKGIVAIFYPFRRHHRRPGGPARRRVASGVYSAAAPAPILTGARYASSS